MCLVWSGSSALLPSAFTDEDVAVWCPLAIEGDMERQSGETPRQKAVELRAPSSEPAPEASTLRHNIYAPGSRRGCFPERWFRTRQSSASTSQNGAELALVKSIPERGQERESRPMLSIVTPSRSSCPMLQRAALVLV